jgi:hypothetical protein
VKRSLALALFALALVACGPSVRTLVEHRHYREAVCAAHEGHDRAFVIDALGRDTALAVHAQRVRTPAVDQRNERRAAEHLAPVALVRVDAQSNVLPLDRVNVEARVLDADHVPRGVIASFTTSLMMTRERLPPSRRVHTYITPANFLRGFAAALTGGLALAVSPMQREWVTVEPTPAEIAMTAPLAMRLLESVQQSSCVESTPGQHNARCRWYFFVAAREDEQLSLELTTRYVAHRSNYDRTARACHVDRTLVRSLGAAGSLDATLVQRFGHRAIEL